jgi:hypothetical protein
MAKGKGLDKEPRAEKGDLWPVAVGVFMPCPERVLLLGSSQKPHVGPGFPFLLINFIKTQVERPLLI